MKLSALDKAIASIDADIQVLLAAKARLIAQQVQKAAPIKRLRSVPPVKDQSAS